MRDDVKDGSIVRGRLRGRFKNHFLKGFSVSVGGEENGKSVRFIGGRWTETLMKKPGKKGSGLGDLLDAALTVAQDPSDKTVGDFASAWGPLTREAGEGEHGFLLEEYRRLCMKTDAFLRVYARVTHGVIPEKKDIAEFEAFVKPVVDEYVKEYVLSEMDDFDSPEETEDFGDELGLLMMTTRRLMRTWWNRKGIERKETFRWEREEQGYCMEPFSLFDSYGCEPGVYLNLYMHLLENSQIFLCDRCGKVYVRDVKRPNEGTRNFCPDCNVGYRTTQSINFRRWKERKEMEELFSGEEIAFEMRQVELPYRGFLAEKIAAVPEFRGMRVGEVSLWREEGKEAYFLLACTDPEKVSKDSLSKTLGKEVARVEPHKAEELFPGRDFGLPPFPMQKRRQYPLIIDRKLLGAGKVVLPTGFRSYFLVFEASDLERSSRVKIVDLQD